MSICCVEKTINTGSCRTLPTNAPSPTCVMRLKRQLFLLTLFTVYLGRVVLGDALHLAECEFSSTHSHTPHSSSGNCALHKHATHGSCSLPVEDQSTESGSDGTNHQHDSTHCSVCQELGQAQDQAFAIDVSHASEAVPLFIATRTVFYLSSGLRGFQSRAPPATARSLSLENDSI